MNQRVLLLLSILSIFILCVLANFKEIEYQGKIKKINFSDTKTTIILENQTVSFLIFKKINFDPECSELIMTGKKDSYKGEEQIIVDKIKCLS
jgi:hypothetical protein